MKLDLNDDETLALLRELDTIIENDRFFSVTAHPDLESDPRQDPTGPGAGAATPAQAIRAAASERRPEATARMKSEAGPTMTLGSAVRRI